MKKLILTSAIVVFVLLSFSESLTSQTLAWRKYTGISNFSNIYDSFDDLYFLNAYTGWVNYHGGKIYKTTNSGINWNLVFQDTSFYFSRKLTFYNEQIGYSGLTNGICKTTNGGLNWTKFTIPGMSNLTSVGISTIDANTVYVCGNSANVPKFAKSTDGGNTWAVTDMSTHMLGVYDIKFFNANTGFAVGYKFGSFLTNSKGIVLYTSTGGASWESRYVTTAVNVNAYQINFNYDNSIGTIVIEGQVTPSVFLKTTNMGVTFAELTFSNTAYVSQAACFKNANTGWVGGSRGANAPLFFTNNGGNTFDTVSWGRCLTAMIFINDTLGFACGYNIYKYSYGTDVGIHNTGETALSYALYQNYPNPFNPNTTIKFSLAKQGDVRISVFDIMGKEIRTLVSGILQSGTYTVDLNADELTSGVYFYKLETDNFNETKKMLLIK